MGRMRTLVLTIGLLVAAPAIGRAEPLVFEGSVVDADTGKPVACTILRGVQFAPNQPKMADAGNETQTADGTFRIDGSGKDFLFERDTSMRFLRVEADGYAAVTTESKLPSDGRVELTVKLKKTPGIRGVVLDPDGMPASNARVVLGTASLKAEAKVVLPASVLLHSPLHEVWAVSGADGSFTLPAQADERVELVALNDAGIGFAVAAPPGQPTAIRLRNYGSVEGKITFDGVAVPGAEVQLQVSSPRSDEDRPRSVSRTARVRLGSDGTFSLPRVPPGNVLIYAIAPGDSAATEIDLFDLKPGDAIRDLIVPPGTVTLQGSVQVLEPAGVEYRSTLTRLCDPIELPADWNDLPIRSAWWNGPAESPEVKAILDTWKDAPAVERPIPIAADGTFELTGLSDGFWSFEVKAFWNDEATKQAARGDGTFHFTVKDGKPNVERIETLPLNLDSSRQLQPGVAMPAVDAVWDDGRKFDWNDQKGKIVLVDIWGPWCGPCKANMPALKQIHDRYKGRQDFALVGFSVDDDPKAPSTYLTEHGYDWPDVYLGSHETGRPKANALGVDGYPTYMLVGRDGKLIDYVHMNSAIERIEQELAKK